MPVLDQDDLIGKAVPLAPAVHAADPRPVGADPSFDEIRDAAFAKSNLLGTVLQKAAYGGYHDFAPQPGYDAFANNAKELQGYEDHFDRFTRSVSPENTQVIKNLIDAEKDNDQTIQNSGAKGYVANLAAGVVDPLTVTTMLIPGLEEVGLGRVGKIAGTMAGQVAAGEAQQAAILSQQETGAAYTDGILPRIATNALIAGVLGGFATRIPKSEFDKAVAEADRNINRSGESTAGAQQVPKTTLEDESVAWGGQWIASKMGKISPVARIFSDGIVEARRLVQQIVDPGFLLNKNVKKGIRTENSVEMLSNQQQQVRNAFMIQSLDRRFAEYKLNGGDLDRYNFSKEASKAMRNGDKHASIPEAAKLAQDVRPIIEDDTGRLVAHGAIEGDGSKVVGALSYFPRAYDQIAIRNNRSELERRLTDWYTKNPLKDEHGNPIKDSPAEVKDRVEDTIQHMQGIVRGTADIGQSVKNPSVLRSRALDAPDHVLEPFLSHDFEHVMKSYNRSVVPQLAMRDRFGSVDLKNEIDEVHDAYKAKIAAATTDKEKVAIQDSMVQNIKDLELMRDRVLNQVGPKAAGDFDMVRAAQLVRSFNYIRMLGNQTLSALPDLGRLVANYGLINTSHRLVQFLTGLTGGLSRADAQRMGTALDVILHTRMHTLEGIGDEMAGSAAGRVMGNVTANFTKITGIAHWDAMMRTLTSQLEQDAMFRAIQGGASKMTLARLAQHGVGADELKAIQAQWAKHGTNEFGLNRARTELWTDKVAAQNVETAIQRAASSSAFFVGKGDLPTFAGSEIGKFMLQFKGFAVSSVNRLTIPLMQGLAHGEVQAANGAMSMLTLGALSYYLKERAYGRQPDLSPARVIAEAVQKSGILAYAPDVYDMAAGPLHLPRFSKFQDHNWMETLGGASIGGAAAGIDAIQRMTGGNATFQDLHKMRQMVPYNNVFYLTRLFNMIEGKIGDLMHLKNSPDRDASSYFNPSEDVDSKQPKPDKKHFLGIEAIPNSIE